MPDRAAPPATHCTAYPAAHCTAHRAAHYANLLRITILVSILIGCICTGLCLGAYRIGFDALIYLITHGPSPSDASEASQTAAQGAAVLWSIRVPRVIIAVAVGAGLGCAGSALQALLRNPLSDPGLIGVSSGAALGASLMLVLAPALAPLIGFSSLNSASGVAIGAFIGALGTAWLVYRLAASSGRIAVAMLLLSGVAINALCGAGIGLLTYLASDAQLRSLTFWSLGSLGGVQWHTLGAAAPFVAVGVGLLLRQRRPLNAMQLGEDDAAHLGVQIQSVKRHVLVGVSLCIGALVSCTGLIGFVGLVTPHCARMLCGPDLRRVMPASMLIGASLSVVADLIARTVAAPAEVPIGVLTALIGAPFFLALLWRNRHRFGA